MKFIPAPQDQSSSLLNPPYFWQAGGKGEKQYHLYREGKRVASLWLQEEVHRPAVMQLAYETIEFRDNSSFFATCLLLTEKESGKTVGSIEKSALNPGEGMIYLKGQVYGWKIRKQADTCLLLMDQRRKRLLSYHYGPGYVRLLLNKPGHDDEQLISLLCICLYLLPVWHSTLSPVQQLSKAQEK